MDNCQECNQDFSMLSKHIKKHKISLRDYTLKWKYKNKVPLCACGCQSETEWVESIKDFNTKIEAHGGLASYKRQYTKKVSTEWDKSCSVCGWVSSGKAGTAQHARVAHNMTYDNYLIKFKYGGNHPTCKCGCGNQVTYSVGDFNEYYENHFHVYVRVVSDETRDKIGRQSIGRLHTEEWKQNKSKELLEVHANSDERRIAISKANKGRVYTLEHRQRISKTRTDRIASGQIIINAEAISKTITQMHMDGRIKYVKGTYTRKNGQTIGYRSSWELMYAQHLDNNPDVKDWLFEKKIIKYQFEGSMHRYLPDFIVHYKDGSTCMVEVKPIRMSIRPKIVQKAIYATEYCRKYGWEYLFASFENKNVELEYY